MIFVTDLDCCLNFGLFNQSPNNHQHSRLSFGDHNRFYSFVGCFGHLRRMLSLKCRPMTITSKHYLCSFCCRHFRCVSGQPQEGEQATWQLRSRGIFAFESKIFDIKNHFLDCVMSISFDMFFAVVPEEREEATWCRLLKALNQSTGPTLLR